MVPRLRELAALVGRGSYVLVVDLMLGIASIATAIKGSHQSALWFALAFLLLLTCVAIYVGYQALRERDEAKAEQPKEVHHHGPYFAGPATFVIGKEEPFATAPSTPESGPPSRIIEGEADNYKVVNAWDLAEEVPGQPLSIINRTLRYVELRGPALIAVDHGVIFDHVGFGMVGSNPESIIWHGNESIPKLGAIVLHRSVLEHCRTESIGFTGDPEFIAQLRSLGDRREPAG